MSVQNIPQNVVSGKALLTHGTFRFDFQVVAEPLPTSDRQGQHGGHRPTALGMPDPHDDHHIAYPFTETMLAIERAGYLLDYGQDVVARLHPAYIHVAGALAAQLTAFEAQLHAARTQGDDTLLSQLVAQLDDALAPGELLLREVGQ